MMLTLIKRKVVWERYTIDVPADRRPQKISIADRRAAHLKTTCDVCGETIHDDYFIGIYLSPGHRNLMMHEACWSESTSKKAN
jgi:hypothetical protein